MDNEMNNDPKNNNESSPKPNQTQKYDQKSPDSWETKQPSEIQEPGRGYEVESENENNLNEAPVDQKI